jgi:hypothetical protein
MSFGGKKSLQNNKDKQIINDENLINIIQQKIFELMTRNHNTKEKV